MNYKEIVAHVSDKHNISQFKLEARNRLGPETHARQEIMYMAFVNDMTIAEIAAKMDRNYTTVKHGIETHGNRLQKARGNLKPTPRSSGADKHALRNRLLSMKIKMGSISGLLQDILSDEVADFVLNETIRSDYESVAEMVADYITEIYFQQKK